MSMVVRTNTMAMNANSALNKNNSTVAGNLQKLSTGFRINRAADDASGLAVSEKMKAQIKALDQASKNAQDGSSLIKTAEGYMGEIHDMLNRIVELAEKSANGTFETKANENYGKDATTGENLAATDRQAIQDEVDQLTTEIDRIAVTANFNELKLLDGSLTDGYDVQDEVAQRDAISAGTYTEDQLTTAGVTASEMSALSSTTKYTVASDMEASLGTGGHVSVNKDAEITTAVWNTMGDDKDKFEESEYSNGETTKTKAEYEGLTDKTGYTVSKYVALENVAEKTGPGAHDAITAGDYTAEQLKAKGLSDDAIGELTATTTYTVADGDLPAREAQAAVKGSALKLQIGETSSSADKLEVSISSFKTADLFKDIEDSGVTTLNKSEAYQTASKDGKMSGGLTINVSNQDTASKAAESVRDIINKVSSQRATLGAMENRLDYTMNNLDTASQNITDANSRIRDTDMAKTMMQYTQGNTLTQAAQAMLAQANQAPSQVLQLLQ